MEEAARQLTRDDLDRDIKLVYKSVLEHYKPGRPRPGRPPSKDAGAKGAHSKSKVRGADLVGAARVLLDTKQFVKTYVPVESLLALRPPASSGGGRPPTLAKGVRVLVTAVIDAKNKGPKVSGMDTKGSSAKGGRKKHGVETKPPPEVVLLPPDPILADLKLAVNKCFQDLYVVLAKFKVSYVVGFESTKDATKLGVKKIGGARVEVHGDGADLESEFRYQGGLDQWVVRCVCGTCDDDGERTPRAVSPAGWYRTGPHKGASTVTFSALECFVARSHEVSRETRIHSLRERPRGEMVTPQRVRTPNSEYIEL